MKTHVTHVLKVIEKLKEISVFCKPEKCEFHVVKTEFRQYVISAQGDVMDHKKTQAVV